MHEAAKFWLIALLFLFGFWLISGGYNSDLAQGGPFLRPFNNATSSYGSLSDFSLIPQGDFSLSSSNSVEQIENAKDPQSIQKEIDRVTVELKKAQNAALASEYTGKFTLHSGNAYSIEANREYLEVDVSPDIAGKVLITGWKIQSTITGKSITIGKGVELPYTNQINQVDSIFVNPGDVLYLNTGRSPIGVSFRTNLCTGYFSQFQEYNPTLRTNCPRPSDEKLPQVPNNFNDSCLDYLDSLSSCRIQIGPLPVDMTPECKSYINDKINYPTCILNHKSDFTFYKPEWRIFLNQNSDLWKNRREVIELVDLKGKIVDTLSY